MILTKYDLAASKIFLNEHPIEWTSLEEHHLKFKAPQSIDQFRFLSQGMDPWYGDFSVDVVAGVVVKPGSALMVVYDFNRYGDLKVKDVSGVISKFSKFLPVGTITRWGDSATAVYQYLYKDERYCSPAEIRAMIIPLLCTHNVLIPIEMRRTLIRDINNGQTDLKKLLNALPAGKE